MNNITTKHFCLLALCMSLLGCGVCLLGCSEKDEADEELSLDGAWMLTRIDYMTDWSREYPYNGMSFGCIYEGDSLCRNFQLMATASGMVIVPGETTSITLIHQGKNRQLYLEDGEPRPLSVVDDTTITIQRYGNIYNWVRAKDMTPQRIEEIRNIIIADRENDANEQVRHYVLSTTERQLRTTNHALIYLLIALTILLFFVVRMVMAKQRRIRRAEERIRLMAEEREQRAQPVTDAMRGVETEFFASDYYQSLRKMLSDGCRLKEDDWQEAERRLQQVYPGFTTNLRSLYRMSELEYQVCLLIKLRFTPKEMAQLLAREASTISTVRSRLYQKVFGRKGSSKDWDDVVMGISA